MSGNWWDLFLALVLQKRCHQIAWDLIHILSNWVYAGSRSKHFFFTHCHKGYLHYQEVECEPAKAEPLYNVETIVQQ